MGSIRTINKVLPHYVVHIYPIGARVWMEYVRLDEVCDVRG